MGSYFYVPSWVVLKTETTQNPERGDIYPYWGAPGMRRTGSPFRVTRLGKLVTESRPLVLKCRVVE
jgi:hypothetical protein